MWLSDVQNYKADRDDIGKPILGSHLWVVKEMAFVCSEKQK